MAGNETPRTPREFELQDARPSNGMEISALLTAARAGKVAVLVGGSVAPGGRVRVREVLPTEPRCDGIGLVSREGPAGVPHTDPCPGCPDCSEPRGPAPEGVEAERERIARALYGHEQYGCATKLLPWGQLSPSSWRRKKYLALADAALAALSSSREPR